LLKSGIGNNVVFDFKTSISFEGNSGPYLQYTYARCQSVLKKSQKKPGGEVKEKVNQEERQVLQLLSRFDEILTQAAEELAPNVVAMYLFDLAQTFNSFYNQHKIADNQFRLSLTEKTAKIIKQGLEVLGIFAPEKM